MEKFSWIENYIYSKAPSNMHHLKCCALVHNKYNQLDFNNFIFNGQNEWPVKGKKCLALR